MTDPGILVRILEVEKTYTLGRAKVEALRGVSSETHRGDFTALCGSSGSGKSTLLNLIGGLDKPTKGEIEIAGRRLGGMSDTEISRFRAQELGFIFQNFNLLPVLSAQENVEYSLRKLALPLRERKERALQALAGVGLEKFAHHRPDQLSGGQRQRVAIARAFVHKPKLVIADEPTGNLDKTTARQILDILSDLNRSLGLTLIIATHDPAVMARAGRILRISDGLIQTELTVKESLEHHIHPTRALQTSKLA